MQQLLSLQIVTVTLLFKKLKENYLHFYCPILQVTIINFNDIYKIMHKNREV